MEMIRSSKVSTLLVKPPAPPFTVLTDWVPIHFWIWSFSVVLALKLLKKNASQAMNSQKLLQTLVKNQFPTLTKSVWPMATSTLLPSGKRIFFWMKIQKYFRTQLQKTMQNNAAVFRTGEVLEEGCEITQEVYDDMKNMKVYDRGMVSCPELFRLNLTYFIREILI